MVEGTLHQLLQLYGLPCRPLVEQQDALFDCFPVTQAYHTVQERLAGAVAADKDICPARLL